MKIQHGKSKQAGFTLFEILAALAILGVALFILLDGHFTALNLHTIMAEEVTYRQLLESAVAKAEVAIYQGTLSDSGDFGERYPDYTWSFDATLMNEGAEGQLVQSLLYTVTATVSGTEEEGDRSVNFFVYDNGVDDGKSGDSDFFDKVDRSGSASGSSGSSGSGSSGSGSSGGGRGGFGSGGRSGGGGRTGGFFN